MNRILDCLALNNLSKAVAVIVLVLVSGHLGHAYQEAPSINKASMKGYDSKDVLRPKIDESTFNIVPRTVASELGIYVGGIGTREKPLTFCGFSQQQLLELHRYIADGSAISFISEYGERSPLFFKQNNYFLIETQYDIFTNAPDNRWLVLNVGEFGALEVVKKDGVLLGPIEYESLINKPDGHGITSVAHGVVIGMYFKKHGFILTESENEVSNIWDIAFNEEDYFSEEDSKTARLTLKNLGVWNK